MICLECRQLDLRAYPHHAAQGFGRCKLHASIPGVFVSVTFSRACPHFTPADAKEVAQRRADMEGGED